MHLKPGFLMGLILGCLVTSCSSYSYYRYYGMEGVDFEKGKLLGPEPKDDRPFVDCAPSSLHKSPCVVVMVGEWFSMKQENEDLKMRLSQCESNQKWI